MTPEELAAHPSYPQLLAAAQFTARYGQPPEYIIEYKGNLLVGPLPEEHTDAQEDPQP